jgi:hypothetical protein
MLVHVPRQTTPGGEQPDTSIGDQAHTPCLQEQDCVVGLSDRGHYDINSLLCCRRGAACPFFNALAQLGVDGQTLCSKGDCMAWLDTECIKDVALLTIVLCHGIALLFCQEAIDQPLKMP